MTSKSLLRQRAASSRRVLADRRTSSVIAVGVAAASLAYTGAENNSGDHALWACISVAGLGLLAAAVGRRAQPFLIALAALVAIASTSREAFSFWVAGAALLFLSARSSRPRTPWPAVFAAAGGLLAALAISDTPPLLPIAVGMAAIALDHAWERSRLLERRAKALEARTKAVEAQARWLEQRAELARELHDVVGHHVTAMVVQAEAGLAGSYSRALEEIADVGRTALCELDTLVVSLREDDSYKGTNTPRCLNDISDVLAAPLRAQGLEVTVDLDQDLTLDDLTARAVYRIAQEALTNVMRHAQAGVVTVTVTTSGEDVTVRVIDDGVGLPDRVTRGAGLLGIGERAAQLGGTWSVTRGRRGGTVVEATLPGGSR